jgi:DNA-binding winged helix-turn-helix (wHTH) protein
MIYVFGECALDTQRHMLRRAGQGIPVRRKAFQALTYLLLHRERVVSRQELGEQIWPAQFISDATLESTIKAVRQAIGDSGRQQQLIQTVYGHGYRFIAAVQEQADPPPPPADEAGASSHGARLAPAQDLQPTVRISPLQGVTEYAEAGATPHATADEGLMMVGEALAVVHTTGARYYEAELYRLKGELLLAQEGKKPTAQGTGLQLEEAEACFQQAFAVARRQQAKSLELRAAISLCRLWQRQGKQEQARQLLASIYHWFTESFDTADLQEAKALLEAWL